MNKKLIIRTIVDLLLAIAVLNAWWFVAVPLAIIGTWLCPYYLEVFVAGLAYDTLFGLIPETGISAYIGTISSLVILLIVSAVKKLVR